MNSDRAVYQHKKETYTHFATSLLPSPLLHPPQLLISVLLSPLTPSPRKPERLNKDLCYQWHLKPPKMGSLCDHGCRLCNPPVPVLIIQVMGCCKKRYRCLFRVLIRWLEINDRITFTRISVHLRYWNIVLSLPGLCSLSPEETQPPSLCCQTQRKWCGQGGVGSLWQNKEVNVCLQASGWSREGGSHDFKQNNVGLLFLF